MYAIRIIKMIESMDNTIESISKSLIKYPLPFEISPKGFL